ncbi:hypothetical protein K402DRAFT_299758, partial [Aulographum hederae CBS 113979]
AEQADQPSSPPRLKVALTVLFHSGCAIWSTLISKTALNSLDAPILLLALQTTVQVILLTTIGVPIGWIKPFKPLSTWRSMLPLTLARLTGILAKTFCLASVNASFYQIARGLLLPFTLLLSLGLLRPTPYFPPLSLVGAGAVMAGFVAGLASDFGKKLTGMKGMVLGVGSSFTTAVESVVVKRYLSPAKKTNITPAGQPNEVVEEELGVWQMVWMSNILSLAFYVPLLILSGDINTLNRLVFPPAPGPDGAGAGADSLAESADFLRLAFLTGLAGFLLTIATFMQIGVTSPTTHMIVTAARGVAQSGLAVVFLREKVTAGRVFSMALILGGSGMYGWAKDKYARGGDKGIYAKVANEEEGRRKEDD